MLKFITGRANKNFGVKGHDMAKNQLLSYKIEECLRAGDIDGARKLYEKCEPNALNYNGSNVFSLSPMPKEFAVWAKERGADINFLDRHGQTPIFEMARRDGDIPLLIELGADVGVVRPDGSTPLHIAAANGRKKAVRALLKAGIHVDARIKDFNGFGHFTPLETALYQKSLSCTAKLDICKILLSRGAEITERSKQFVSSFSESFHRHTAGKKVSKSLQNQAAALKTLCDLFHAAMLPAASFHDGVSPIIMTTVGGGYNDIFNELWDFLVPPRGRAQTAQGEVVRIAGRVSDELLRNGGLNWDEDYRKMLAAFRKYLSLGVPADDQEIAEITDVLMGGDVLDGALLRLRHRAEYWVGDNPEVMPLLETDYTR